MPTNTHRNDRTQDRTALVFGATGKQADAVAAALTANGWCVRALVRNPDSDQAKRLASAGVELHTGDFSDIESVRAAMIGVHSVFSMQPNSGSPGSGISDADEVRFGKSVADIAVESGVQHFVYSSASIISRGATGLCNLDTKIEIENHVRSLEIASTIIRPGTFMDLFTLAGMGLDQGVFSFFVHPAQAFEVISVQDIGKIAAFIFDNMDRYAGRTIEIAGDQLTGLQLAEALTIAAGRPIAYQRFPEEVLAGNDFLARNAKLFDEGRAAANADIVALQSEFGPLLSVKQWLAGAGEASLIAALAVNYRPL